MISQVREAAIVAVGSMMPLAPVAMWEKVIPKVKGIYLDRHAKVCALPLPLHLPLHLHLHLHLIWSLIFSSTLTSIATLRFVPYPNPTLARTLRLP